MRYCFTSIRYLLAFSLWLFSYQVQSNAICSNTSSVSESGVLFDSGGNASNYNNNENCGFLIEPIEKRDITLSFSAFNYENFFDYLYVYDGTDDSGVLLGSFTGTSIPASLTAISGAMYIVHSTDFSVQRSGFSASWTSNTPLNLISEWHFDEELWSGANNEVIDNQGAINGIAVNGANTVADGLICRAASFDGIDDYVTVSGISDTLNGSSSLSFWIKTEQQGDNTYWRAPGITGIEEANRSSNDIFWGYLSRNGRLGFGKGGSHHVASSVSVNNSQWQHIVLTRDDVSGDISIYINGTFNRAVEGRLGGIPLTFSSLGRIEDTAGTPGYFSGLLDEVLVFASVIDADQVQSIYNNQLAGNSWDGSERHCDPVLIAEWRLEEDSWSGQADEIIDSSGNDHHGQLLYNASSESSLPALSGSEGTCAYGSFSSGAIAIDGLPVETTNGEKTTVSFWMRWDGTNGSMPIGWSYYDLWFYNGSFGFNTWNNDIYGISSSALRDSWHHITAEFTNGSSVVSENRLWVDGVEQVLSQRIGSPSSSYRSAGNQLRLGGAVNSTNYRFHGNLDEVRVYDAELTTAQVVSIMNETHLCTSALAGYFSIYHDNAAVYCLSEPLAVTAHNSDASVATNYNDTVTLNTQTGHGSWSLVSGNGTLIDSTIDDGIATYTFASSDNGSAQFSLYYPEGDNGIDIDVYDSSARDDDTEGSLSFSATGFSVTASPLTNPPPVLIDDPIDHQLSAQAFTVHIAAYGTDPENGQCGIIENYTGDKNLTLSTIYSNPTTGNTQAVAASSITFVDGQASTAVQYDDVGQIQLSLTDLDEDISGQSNTFVVKPADFVVAIDDNPATAQSGDGFIAAGAAFSAKVQAVNADGIVAPNYGNETPPENISLVLDSLLFPSGGNVGSLSNAGSFSKQALGDNNWVECAIENSTCSLPSVATVRYGANGTYTIVDNMTGAFSCSNSVFGDPLVGVLKRCEYIANQDKDYFENADLSWNEVGTIAVNAQVSDGDYLGAGNITSSESTAIGRFYPSHFLLGSNMVTNSCIDFTYLSQPELSIAYTLSAINEAGEVVQNYDDGLGYPVGNITYVAEYANNGFDIASRLQVASAVWQAGEYSVLDNNAVLNRASNPEAPLLNVQFGVRIDDADSVLLESMTMNAGTDVICETDNSCNAGIIGTGSFYYGRLKLDSAYGPETADLPVNFATEYWNGAEYVTHLFDDCTSISRHRVSFSGVAISADSQLTVDLSGGATTAQFSELSPLLINFNQGQAGLSFSAPGVGIALDSFSIDVNLIDTLWLSHDWRQDGDDNNDNELPAATIRFKSYRGHDRILYWRHQ
ncbi:DUF6701 domain-containing protein [Eionea flava]